jgi:TIR domain
MATEIFVSYSHKDAAYLERKSLLGYLRGLKRRGASFWTDEQIPVGTKWNDQIKAAIRRADIAMVLVSRAFLKSKYVRHGEIRPLLVRSRDEGLIIFPIILSPCEWQQEPWLRQRQFIPTNDRTIEKDFAKPAERRKKMFKQIKAALRDHVAKIEKTKRRPVSTATAMKSFSKSINVANKLYPQVRAFTDNQPEKHQDHSVIIEGKGDHVVRRQRGAVTTLTPADLEKLSERQLRHISIFQRDLEKSYAKWEKLYRRRRKEMPNVTEKTRLSMREAIADMKDSLDRVIGFLNAANLDIEDHYAIFRDVIDKEAALAYGIPRAAS